MYEKARFSGLVLCIAALCIFASGCAGQRSGGTGGQGYIKPETVADAEFGTDERISGLEDEIERLQSINNELGSELDRSRREAGKLKQGIGELEKSCDAIIDAGGRHGETIQETVAYMEVLRDWVVWAYNRLNSLADTAQEGE